MSTKPNRPAFQSIELDPIDARLEAKAAEKGIPTLVLPAQAVSPLPPRPEAPQPLVEAQRPSKPAPVMPSATPRARMKPLKIELPDYAWIELKKRAAEQMVSLRYLIMEALRDKGILIKDIDMVEDGRRFRD